jgi:uncharacterized cysteine cluster protein YcgN (CxxCxxCC family)
MWVAHAAMPTVVRCMSLTSTGATARVTKYRLLIYRAALVLLFSIYPGLSTEVVKTFRWVPQTCAILSICEL